MDDGSKGRVSETVQEGERNNSRKTDDGLNTISLYDRVMSDKTPFKHDVLALSLVSGSTYAGLAVVDLRLAKQLTEASQQNALKAKVPFGGHLSGQYVEQMIKTDAKTAYALSTFSDSQRASAANTAAVNEFKTVAKDYATFGPEVPGVPRQLQIDRHLFFNGSASVKLGRGTSAADFIGTAEEVASSKKLFLLGSREANTIQLLDYTNQQTSPKAVLAREASFAAEREMGALKQLSSKVAGTGYSEVSTRAFGKGLITSVASMTAGYAMDHVIGSTPTNESIPRLLIDGCMVPAALAGGRYRVAAAGGLFAASRTIGLIETSLKNSTPTKGRYDDITQNETVQKVRALKF